MTGLSRTPTIADVDKLAALAEVRALIESGRARELRLQARLSLSEVADAADVGVSTVARWEAADRRPRGEPALRYLAVLQRLEHMGGAA